MENEENQEDQGKSLDFFRAKQTILSSYFQMINLMILKRINGVANDFPINFPKKELNEEFEIEKESQIWGTSRLK